MKLKLFIIIVAAVSFCCSCNTDDNPVPKTRVDFDINFHKAEYAPLQNPGGWIYITGGYAGIFVYNFDNETYFAFDRACTCDYHHDPLVYDERTHTLRHSDTIKNCNSRFNVIMQGAVQYGDATHALRQYDVLVYQGYLRIMNGVFE